MRAAVLKTKSLDERKEIKLYEKLVQLLSLHSVVSAVLKAKTERHVAVDTRERLRDIRHFLAVRELLLDRRGELRALKCGVKSVKASVLGYQLERGLLAYAGNSGDVVRRVAHKRLYVNELLGRNAVGFKEFSLAHIKRFLGLCKENVSRIADKLKRVAVTRKQICRNTLALCFLSERAENIVSLVALKREHATAHLIHAVLGIRQLYRKLLGHSLSLRLVSVVHLVSEGGRLKVKRHRAVVGREMRDMALYNIRHSVYCIGIKTVLVGEQSDTVKCSVENTVTVNNKQLFHFSSKGASNMNTHKLPY